MKFHLKFSNMQDVAAPHLLKGLLQEYLLPILKTRFETGGRIMSRFCEAEYFLQAWSCRFDALSSDTTPGHREPCAETNARVGIKFAAQNLIDVSTVVAPSYEYFPNFGLHFSESIDLLSLCLSVCCMVTCLYATLVDCF